MFRMLSTFPDKSAEAWCTLAYMDATMDEPLIFIGKKRGTICYSRGSNGFGFDAIFGPFPMKKTFAEMDADEKNNVSHKFNAFSLFKNYIESVHQFAG